jgi:hypothetical protein
VLTSDGSRPAPSPVGGHRDPDLHSFEFPNPSAVLLRCPTQRRIAQRVGSTNE